MRCLPVLILAVAATRGQEDEDTEPTNDAEMNGTIEMTEEERSEMLDKHNRYRSKHNASALELDEEASYTQKFAKQPQGWAKKWSLGCVNSRPAARGSLESGGGIHAT